MERRAIAATRALKTALCTLILACIAGLPYPEFLYANSAIKPLEYPKGIIGHERPLFIWQDIYSEKDSGQKVKFRLTIKEVNAPDFPVRKYFFIPERFQASFYFHRPAEPLDEGDYLYSIERILDGAPITSRYFHYMRYPLEGTFSLRPGRISDYENLGAHELIRYLNIERNNRLGNGYNALFFAGSGTMSLGIGILFYKIIHIGIISDIITVVSFTSSAVGYSAAGYYGFKYQEGRAELKKIIETGNGTSLGGAFIDGRIITALEYKF